MKNNNTLFWVLAVIVVYVVVVFPNIKKGTFGGGGTASRGQNESNGTLGGGGEASRGNDEKEASPTVEELDNARNRLGYTI